MFFLLLFYYFRRATSELHRPIAVKLCHMIAIWVRLIMQVQKFRGPSPPKKFGAKNMQNLARFQTTSDFDREYLWISKIRKRTVREDSPAFHEKKSDELWSTNYRELCVSLDPPKLHFSGDYISAVRGYWPPNFNMHYRLIKAC